MLNVEAPSQRGLLWLAFAATALAGFVDALGFLAFGRLFLASPDANSIFAAVALPTAAASHCTPAVRSWPCSQGSC